MTNMQAIAVAFGMITAAGLFSNAIPPAVSQAVGPVIPPVEGFVPAGDAAGTSGPWHLWRMNRHTGQVSFCTAEVAPGMVQAAPSGTSTKQPAPVTVECTRTTASM